MAKKAAKKAAKKPAKKVRQEGEEEVTRRLLAAYQRRRTKQ